MKYRNKTKKRNYKKNSYRNKHKNIKTKRLYLLRRKYKCVKGGAVTSGPPAPAPASAPASAPTPAPAPAPTPAPGPPSGAPIVGLPVLIDTNNIAYTCNPIPQS